MAHSVFHNLFCTSYDMTVCMRFSLLMWFQTYELHELQKFNFLQTIITLENKLEESQTEKDALADFR